MTLTNEMRCPLFALPQIPLCRVDQAKTISLIGLEVPALGTLAGVPPRGLQAAQRFPRDINRSVAGNRKA